jgi:hypothetical protein
LLNLYEDDESHPLYCPNVLDVRPTKVPDVVAAFPCLVVVGVVVIV